MNASSVSHDQRLITSCDDAEPSFARSIRTLLSVHWRLGVCNSGRGVPV